MNPMQMKLPEERRASAAKGRATRQRNRLEAFERENAARVMALELRYGIDELRKERDALVRVIEFGKVANVLTGSALLSESEIVGGAKPWTMFCGIYFLICQSRVVYVGQSVNVFSRIGAHSNSGKEFDRFAFIPCKSEHLDFLESLYIHLLRPALNGTTTTGTVAAPLNLDKVLAAASKKAA